jgi:hypothetical protein
MIMYVMTTCRNSDRVWLKYKKSKYFWILAFSLQFLSISFQHTFSQYIFFLNISTFKNFNSKIKKYQRLIHFKKKLKIRIFLGTFLAYFIRYSYYTPIHCKIWTLIPLICKQDTFIIIPGKWQKIHIK